MKKKILIPLMCFFLFGCKSSVKAPSTYVNKDVLKDNWLLKNVSFVEPNMFDKIILFNDVTNQCFKDSRWQFNPTSKLGNYSINDLYCSYGKRNLSFRFLKTEEKTGYSHIVLKAKNKAGLDKNYRIKITKLTNTSMQWKYVVYIKNKRYTINMQFEKAS